MSTRTIKVGYLARVEGEGGLLLQIKDGRVVKANLNIFEPPRFFEAFLRGRSYREAPDFAARVCGICPIAYLMSSMQALEAALGVQVPASLQDLRRLVYLGEWIESHALHVFFLHAPDFLGYQDGFELARNNPDLVKMGLRLKKAGNRLVTVIGGREIHPVNFRVGGFYRAVRRGELTALLEELDWAEEAALQTVRWAGGLEFPDFEQDYEFVALRHPEEYPITRGRLASSRGLDIAAGEFEAYFLEEQVPHSHALQGYQRERGAYLVGPLARYSLNYDRLTPLAQEAARAAGLGPVCRNPFQGIVVRGVELLYAVQEAKRLIRDYAEPEAPAVLVRPRAGRGAAITEAPRGILYHRYRLDDRGLIGEARIMPPTSQNQKSMEADLARVAARHLDLPDESLQLRLEQTIRNYDPCISCATHWLRLEVKRT